MASTSRLSNQRVFINVPFDHEYAPLFRALLFAIEGCGFSSCCALDEPGNAEPRLTKIFNLIEQSALSIHDISRTELDKKTRLPRFNMPLELGICLGYRRLYSHRGELRDCLIFDKSPYKYQKFISDLAGNDIVPHQNKTKKVILNVRHFLNRYSPVPCLLGEEIYKRHGQFERNLFYWCQQEKLHKEQLDFFYLSEWMHAWWEEQRGL